MASFAAKPVSYWIDSAEGAVYPPLPGGLDVDVAVIGGGMVGLTTALLLKRAGRSVAVLEARRVAAQVTGRSTAKLTSQHGLIYAYLMESFGESGARHYAEANQAAIEIIDTIRTQLGISCDFERRPAYVVAEAKDQLPALEAEVRAAEKLGLPAALVSETELPFPVAGAIRFEGQAIFHPVRYLAGIAAAVDGGGCRVFEETRVLDVQEGNPCEIKTEWGTVRARDVVIATHLPILDRGAYFAKAFPMQHVVLGVRVAPEQVPRGMYISIGKSRLSLRPQPTAAGPLLIATNDAYRIGHADPEAKMAELLGFLNAHFRVASVDYRWVNQEYYSVDRVPYVGPLTAFSRHLYVATGFSAWGLSNGTVAATIISDEIIGNRNRWAGIFRSTRVSFRQSGKKLLDENVHVGEMWIKERLAPGGKTAVEALAPGDGDVIDHAGAKLAVCRDTASALHALSPICTHLGCIVHWNRAAGTWDCPCHGSRYDAAGRVVSGPAVKDLEAQAL